MQVCRHPSRLDLTIFDSDVDPVGEATIVISARCDKAVNMARARSHSSATASPTGAATTAPLI